ncbi:MAG: InlB B-repeat-containing protein [Clostridia bacterium]|nr:InlB B-repeat-containing protein [Clostridia bacterium]
MKRTKKILSVFLALLMIISVIPMSSITASAASIIKTQSEAVAWLNLQKNECYGTGSCTHFVSAYMNWLTTGTADAYGSYILPQSPFGFVTFAQKNSQIWTVVQRTDSTVPQAGDIFVSGDAHVGVVIEPKGTTGAKVVDQNSRPGWSVGGGTNSRIFEVTWGSSASYSANYFIRPKFSGTPTPDIDWVTGLAGNHYLQNKGSGDWLSVSENKNASTQPINTWGTWYKEFRVNLVAIGNGYKINFPVISSLLMNPYSDSPTVGTKVNLYQDVNDITQWWGFEKVGDAYAIRCMYNPSLVLTDNGVMPATLTTYTGASNQLWYLHPYTYSVSYNANGGSGAPSSQTKYFNESLTLSSTKPTRSGYTFLGWSTSSTATSASYSASSSFTTNANTTLYAVWKEDVKTYTISYDANGGSGAPASQTIEYASCLLLTLEIPTRAGYTFLGWSESSTATTPTYERGDFYCDAEKSVILYAVWTPNEYTVSYNANGGTGAPSSQTKYHDTALILSTTIPTRSGYTFLGWSTSSTATSASYLAGSSFTSNANTTLYAVWQKDVVEPKVHISNNNIILTLGWTESTYIYAWATDTTSSYTVQYQIADANIVGCSWGEWTSDNKCPLTITAKSKGTTTVTVSLIDYETKEVLDSVDLTVTIGVHSSYVNFSIKEPSTTTVRHNDGIILHLNADGNIPDGARIHWSADNNNFDGGYSEDGMQCLLISKNNGYTVITATLYDADDNVIATDSIEMRSKAGFFDKIGGFFRSLFGTTKIYEN